MKITVVGAGNVGASTVKALADSEYAQEIVLVDIMEGVPQGKALDIAQSIAIAGKDTNIIGTNDYEPTKDSDIAVITAGFPRKPGMTRDDLLKKNAEVITGVVKNVAKYSPNCIIICVTNPLDAMVQLAYKVSGFPKNRVLGMAGVLDRSRFRLFVAEELNCSTKDVNVMVVGSHGDSMVPLVRHSTVYGRPLTEVLSKEAVDRIVQRTRDGGAEIVNLLKTGSAFYAPAAAVVQMVESILKDKNRMLPCAALCEGEYGINGVFCGVPVQLGRKGITRIVDINLNKEELEALHKSAAAVKSLTDTLGL